MSLAVHGTTCVASGQFDADAPSSFPVCAHLHHFLFVEDRTVVHEAGDLQGSAPRVGLPHPQKAVAPSPRCLGAHAEEVQPGATCPEREHVALANDDDLEPTLVLPAAAPGAAAHGPERSHSGLEAHLERLFKRGRELAGTLFRPEVDILKVGIVVATKAHRRHILTMVPDRHNRPSCSSHWARSPCTT